MANELETTQNQSNKSLNSSLANASAIITRDYLDRLETYDIVKPSEEDIDISIADCGKFYKLTKLVLNREENFLNKLTTIVNVVSSVDCSLATIIKSDGFRIDYYFGIISKNARLPNDDDQKRRKADAAAFKGALTGNLLGSELEEWSQDEVNKFKKDVLMHDSSCYSAVSGIVALRDEEDKSVEGYVQGIENLTDSLKGQKYTIVMLADPVDTSELQTIRQGYEMLHTQLSAFARSTVTINESDTLSLSKSRTAGITEGISKGIAMTQSQTKSTGKYFGGGASIGVSMIISANVMFNAGVNSSTADTAGKTHSTMNSRQRSNSVTDTTSSSKTAGKSLQLSYENRTVKALLDKIDKHLERLDECESFGAFDCAAYVIADNRETALTVASNYNALMRGKNSSVQSSHINSWDKSKDTEIICKYIGSLVHPRFWQDKDNKIIVTPASIISGDELAIQVGLPKKSVTGVTVIPMAPFGRNITKISNNNITLGNLYHMGLEEDGADNAQKVLIDIDSLAMHTFITGSTGTGKSTAIYSILDKLMQQKIKGQNNNVSFLVIEPAKGEYKDVFGGRDNVAVYGTNPELSQMLRINPFSFAKGIHILEHLDRLIEIFNVCWPMYAAMPAVLKKAVERAYEACGWDLVTSKNSVSDTLFPTFEDVCEAIYQVIGESAYSEDNKSDYIGSLATRIESLTTGFYRIIFSNDDLSDEMLFDENVIVDLSRIGSGETKALIMGILVMKLQEYHMVRGGKRNSALQHVTVLEEAHNLLKRTSTEQSSEAANLFGKSVEMIANAIAEMRTYGEGFIIADQSPGLMDMSVIRNTNTKIVLRLPDYGDRQLVGKSIGLNENQINELSKLPRGVAAIFQNDWLETILCKIDYFDKEQPYKLPHSKGSKIWYEKIVAEYLIKKVLGSSSDYKVNEIAGYLSRMSLPIATKRLAYNAINMVSPTADDIKKIIYDIVCTKNMEKEAEEAQSLEEWADIFRYDENMIVSNLGEAEQNMILECIVREHIERFNRPAEYLNRWKEFVREVVK